MLRGRVMEGRAVGERDRYWQVEAAADLRRNDRTTVVGGCAGQNMQPSFCLVSFCLHFRPIILHLAPLFCQSSAAAQPAAYQTGWLLGCQSVASAKRQIVSRNLPLSRFRPAEIVRGRGAGVEFTASDGDVIGGFNPDRNTISLDRGDGQHDFVADLNPLVLFP